MPNPTPYGRLAEFTKLTDRMVLDASKDALANAAMMLAIQVGQYQRMFGTLPLENTMILMEEETLNEDQAGLVADGLENLAMALVSVNDDEKTVTVQ
jgi:hypothetical protein